MAGAAATSTVWAAEFGLDSLTAALRKHEQPPDDAVYHYNFDSPIGPMAVGIEFPRYNGISCTSYEFLWEGAEADTPSGIFAGSFAFCAVDAAGAKLLRLEGFISNMTSDAWVMENMSWSLLRSAVAGGARLQAEYIVAPGEPKAAGDSRLRVAPPAGSLALGGSLLDGPFTDVTVVADGRSFRAHRVTLAAASPVFRSMFESSMAEGQAAVVELKETDAAAVELLLQHVYGAAVEVPLLLAPALYGLADQYQLQTGLARQLALWLAGARPEPAALCRLLPAAHTLCRAACNAGLYYDASQALSELRALPEFGCWPADLLTHVLKGASILSGFAAVVAWMAAQQQPAKQRHRWPVFLDALKWGRASRAELRLLWDHSEGSVVPGLQARVYNALDELCKRQEAAAAAAAEAAADE